MTQSKGLKEPLEVTSKFDTNKLARSLMGHCNIHSKKNI